MASSSSQAAASTASWDAAAKNGARPVNLPWRFLVGAVPSLVTLAFTLWGITGSSYWRDEAATMAAVQRSPGQLLRLLGHVDADHGAYYIMMWSIVRVGGAGELATRLPSALAMAAAAALVAAIGSRVVSPLAGLAAGLVFAILPSTSFYAQNARPDALTVALAVGATYLLVRVLQADATARRRWLIWYAACVAVLGLINILGLLLLGAHAVTVADAASRKNRAGRRALALGWLAAALAAMAAVSPMVFAAYAQRAALGWIGRPSFGKLLELPTLLSPMSQPRTYGAPFAASIPACVVAGLLVSVVRRKLRKRWPRDIAAISLPWLILPGAVLFASLQLTPLYSTRYLLFSVPALALLAGAGLAALGRVAGAVALVAITLLGLPAQQAIRHADGHGENIRLADQIVASTMRRGDAVIYNNPTEESLASAYPYGFAELKNIGQAQTPARSATLTGIPASPGAVRRRLSRQSRVWIVDFREWVPPGKQLRGLGFQFVRYWRINDIRLYLYSHGSRR